MYRYRVSGLIPRYWDACRTFITSRDSLTRNAHPDSDTPRFQTCPHLLEIRTLVSKRCDLVPVMSSREPERQAFLSRSCPKNIGNLRQFTWYCRQVYQRIAMPAPEYHHYLYFCLDLGLYRRTVILNSHPPSLLLLPILSLTAPLGCDSVIAPNGPFLCRRSAWGTNSCAKAILSAANTYYMRSGDC
jgi:hypothetical protein